MTQESSSQDTNATSVALAAQEERNRLARDLHDSIKQQLFSIHVGTAAVGARWENDPEGAKTALADVRQSAQAALVEMNALLQQLSPAPLAKVGLVQALREQAEPLPQLNSIVVAYLAAYVAVLLPIVLFIGFLIPDESAPATVATVMVGCLVNVAPGLLLLKTAVALERRYPASEKRPSWAGGITFALFLAFLIAAGLALTEAANVGVLVLAGVTAVYIFTPRRDFSAAQSSKANLLPRLLEMMLGAILALLLPVLVSVPTALGLVIIPVQAIGALDPANTGVVYKGTLMGMVQELYLTHLTAFLLLTAVPAILMLLVLMVAKIAAARQK